MIAKEEFLEPPTLECPSVSNERKFCRLSSAEEIRSSSANIEHEEENNGSWQGWQQKNESEIPQQGQIDDVEEKSMGSDEEEMMICQEELPPLRPCQLCQVDDEKRGLRIDRYSRVAFPTIFFAFCLVYWIYYMWLTRD